MELTCARPPCGKRFHRRVSEHNRSVKAGRLEYCSRSCCVIAQNTGSARRPPGRGRWRDDLSPFRSYARSIRKRDPETDVDVAYLRELWLAQDGRCALSRLELRLPETTANPGPTRPLTASVDRIDHALGYRRGNIRWLSFMANCARNGFTDAELLAFCAAVVSTS